MHTTNYTNTFIKIAPDCPVTKGETPPVKGGNKTVANLQYEIIGGHPYEYTSDDVIFEVYAMKANIAKQNLKKEREKFFSKGQPCLRSSPLAKRYGWGFHYNAEGKVAAYAAGTAAYKKLSEDKTLKQVNAMRSKKA